MQILALQHSLLFACLIHERSGWYHCTAVVAGYRLSPARMPLMALNVRATPGGLVSHKQFLQAEAATWLGAAQQADLTFICSRVEAGREAVAVVAHQYLLAPHSSLLRDLFTLHTCSHRRDTIHITLDTDPKVLIRFLNKTIRK